MDASFSQHELAELIGLFGKVDGLDQSEIQKIVGRAIASGGLGKESLGELVVGIEKALSPSEQCAFFALLGASVELTGIVVKPGPSDPWITISDLARRLRVSKQSVSKRIERLEKSGALKTRSGARGAKLVNLAQFNEIFGALSDASRRASGSSSVGRTDVLCFSLETCSWACGGRSGHGLVSAIAALFSVDLEGAAALLCKALGRGLIEAHSEAQNMPAEPGA